MFNRTISWFLIAAIMVCPMRCAIGACYASGCCTASSCTDSSCADSSCAGPSLAEPSSAGPSCLESSCTKPSCTEPSCTEPSCTMSSSAGSTCACVACKRSCDGIACPKVESGATCEHLAPPQDSGHPNRCPDRTDCQGVCGGAVLEKSEDIVSIDNEASQLFVGKDNALAASLSLVRRAGPQHSLGDSGTNLGRLLRMLHASWTC